MSVSLLPLSEPFRFNVNGPSVHVKSLEVICVIMVLTA
jgi:hypothetical protein